MTKTEKAMKLTDIRKAIGLSQGEMAYLLELSTREYQAFEWAERETPNLYLLAAERLAMTHAVRQRAPMKAPSVVREEASILTKMVEASST